jgi:hypothetical protein
MKTSVSWSPAPSLNVVSVQRGGQAWTVTVDSRQPTSCPGCGTQSKSRHSAYSRTLRDLSAQGAPVIINVRLARWRCRNQRCDRRIFTERLSGLAAPFARRTARLAGIVRLLGHSADGRPSERLMRRFGMPVSDTTILRSLKEHARVRSGNGAVHVAGIDDWAWRKGANYGTIIVDLERRQVVDLLADRSAATAASWFKDHPEVQVVSRDRAGLYADAARQGAPQARQVADRFHLLQNFRETVERQLGRYEAPISDSLVDARDNQATPPLPARSDCASDAVTQKRLMRRGRHIVRKSYSMRSGHFLKGAVPSGRSPASSVLVADGSNVGSVASICRTATPWRQTRAPRHILALCWRGVGPKALPKSATCSLRFAIAAIPGPTVSLLPGATASPHSMASSRRVSSRRSQRRSVCEHWIR